MRYLLRLVLPFLLLSGCTGSIPVNVVDADPDADVDALLEEAAWYIGTPIVRVSETYGAISMSIHETRTARDGGRVTGVGVINKGCSRYVWAYPDPKVIAHEIGHALGLEHHPDPDNLMNRKAGGEGYLTDDQYDRIDLSLSNLNACTARGAGNKCKGSSCLYEQPEPEDDDKVPALLCDAFQETER